MMDNNKMICYCDQVTKGEIIEAMEKGAKTLADIKRMTGACCSCKCAELNPSGKCCAQDIALVMKEYLSNVNVNIKMLKKWNIKMYIFPRFIPQPEFP